MSARAQMSGSTVRTTLSAAGAHATTAVINKRPSTIILTYDSFVCVREIACRRLEAKLLGWLNFTGQFWCGVKRFFCGNARLGIWKVAVVKND